MRGEPGAERATLVVGYEDVRRLLDLETVLDLQREAFIHIADERTTTAPNLWLRPRLKSRGWIKVLAGHDEEMGVLGSKIIARFPENPPGTNLGAVILLFDETFGFPAAIVDGSHITALKTAAGAALATAALARPDGRAIGVVGSGELAWWSLAFLAGACPNLRAVTVYSRSVDRREGFAARAREELGFEARAVKSVSEATRAADVIVTATNATEAVLLPEHVGPGQHINAVGIRTEIAPEVIAHATVFCEGRREALVDGKFGVALRAGAVREEDLGPMLGEVLSERHGGRTSSDELTLFDSSGVAIQDLVCARAVVERARAAGAGTLLNLAPEVGADA